MAEESYPAELKYFKEHDWVRVEGDEAVFGITWYAQDALGEIVYVDLPDPGTVVSVGAKYGELESVKAVTDVYAPVGGEVTAKNEPLDDELIVLKLARKDGNPLAVVANFACHPVVLERDGGR